jgi:endoglucanase
MGLVNRGRRAALWRLATAPALAWLAAGTAAAPPRLAPALWPQFKRSFVTDDGRVLDDDGSTHSEGLGTALLACAAVADGDTFARIHRHARTLQRDDGLTSWRVQAGGRVIDVNNATDGDLYIGWALARAARAFGAPAYAQEARRIARAVRAYCVRASRHGAVLVPGRDGFNRATYVVANPSYWVLPAFDALAAVDPHPQWKALIDTALALLARARFGQHGLTADWIEIDDAVRPWRERPARFGYEAIRVPLFLYWSEQFAHPQLAAFVRYAAAPAFPAWTALDGDAQSAERAPAGFEAIARLARALPGVTTARLPGLNSSYYSSSLTLLAALANDDLVERRARHPGADAAAVPERRRAAID